MTRVTGSTDDGRDSPASTRGYVGYIIDGRYKVESVLGRGGMGVVYAARHEVIDKVVAIKVLLPTEDTDVVERFVNEARAATAIGNAHIVDTLDFGELPDGSTYFVMENLEGQTLAKRIKKERFLPVERAIHIAQQIAEGMGAAHDASIVHRDLKPENIFITRQNKDDDFVKLLDFGIAKVANAQNKITRAGSIFGTPHYMSPEQAAGTEVDRRTDIYSLGVIMYEMACGQVPFDAENPMGLLTQHMYKDPIPLTEIDEPPQPIPVGYDAIVLKCLRKRPEERYPTMGEVARDLERLARGAAPAAVADLLMRTEFEAHPELVRAAQAATRKRRTSRGPVYLALAAVFGGGGALALSLLAPDSDSEPEARTDFVAVVPSSSAVPTPQPDAARPAAAQKPVALVVFPSDASVRANGKDLGAIPVKLVLGAGETISVKIERDGFYPITRKLDASEPVVVVEMSPIPGKAPSVPIPDAAAIEQFKREHLGRASSADAGTPLTRIDAGSSHPPRNPQAAPPRSAGAAETAKPPPLPPPLLEEEPPTSEAPLPSAPGSGAPPSDHVDRVEP